MRSKFHYEVHMAGRCVARFGEAQNLFIEKELPESIGNIVLRKGTGDHTFSEWILEMDTGRILKKRMEIWLWYQEKDLLAKWALISARPVDYQETSEGIEVLELEYRSVDKWVEDMDMEFHSRWYNRENLNN